MLNQFLFKIWSYLFGIRFYITLLDQQYVLYHTATVSFTRGKDLVFHFYKTDIEYHIYRFGSIRTIKKPLYGIAANFDEDHPELVTNYNNRLMTFYIPYANLISEKNISKYLLDIYLNYILKQVIASKHHNDDIEDLPKN